MQPLYSYPRPLGTFHNRTLGSTVRSGDSSIMRIQNRPPAFSPRKFSIFSFCFSCPMLASPPPLHFCVETGDGSKCFSGECLGERAQGKVHIKKQNGNVKDRKIEGIWFTQGKIHIEKQNSECERQKHWGNMIHTGRPDNPPPSDKYTLLSLALDFPTSAAFIGAYLPFVRSGGGSADSKLNVNDQIFQLKIALNRHFGYLWSNRIRIYFSGISLTMCSMNEPVIIKV